MNESPCEAHENAGDLQADLRISHEPRHGFVVFR